MLQRFMNSVLDLIADLRLQKDTGYQIPIEIPSYSSNLYSLTRMLRDGLKFVGSRA